VRLSEKIRATHEAANSDRAYTTFLKNFGEFTVPKLDKKEVSAQEYILQELKSLRLLIQKSEKSSDFRQRDWLGGDIEICTRQWTQSEIAEAMDLARADLRIRDVILKEVGDHRHIVINVKPEENAQSVQNAIESKLDAVRPKRRILRIIKRPQSSKADTI